MCVRGMRGESALGRADGKYSFTRENGGESADEGRPPRGGRGNARRLSRPRPVSPGGMAQSWRPTGTQKTCAYVLRLIQEQAASTSQVMERKGQLRFCVLLSGKPYARTSTSGRRS